MNNFTKRTITGVLFVICVIGSGVISQWVFTGLFLLVAIGGMIEFSRIVNKSGAKVHLLSTIVTGSLAYGLIGLVLLGSLPVWTLLLLLLLIPLLLITELYRESDHPFVNVAVSLMGIFWIMVPLALLSGFFNQSEGPAWLHGGALLGFFLILWIYDSGAYIVGSLLGKHPMFPRISPKKSWEGFAGGAVAGMLTAYMISASFIEFKLWEWSVIAIIIIVFGTFGDLTESMLKRSAGVKDSGNLLPGHGGILDRFDAVLLAAPAVFIVISLLRQIAAQ